MSEYPVVEAFATMMVVVGLIVASLFILHVISESYTCSIKCIKEKIKDFFK